MHEYLYNYIEVHDLWYVQTQSKRFRSPLSLGHPSETNPEPRSPFPWSGDDESRFKAKEATDAFRNRSYPEFFRIVESFDFLTEERRQLQLLWHKAHEIQVWTFDFSFQMPSCYCSPLHQTIAIITYMADLHCRSQFWWSQGRNA